jgi:hypothetical protein
MFVATKQQLDDSRELHLHTDASVVVVDKMGRVSVAAPGKPIYVTGNPISRLFVYVRERDEQACRNIKPNNNKFT